MVNIDLTRLCFEVPENQAAGSDGVLDICGMGL